MPSDAAALSAVVTALSDLEDRVTAAATRYEGTHHDDLVAALYEAERQLRGARRAVERARTLVP